LASSPVGASTPVHTLFIAKEAEREVDKDPTILLPLLPLLRYAYRAL
jgi:hypothetical protein